MAEIIQQTINRADLNTIADVLRSLKFGDILRSLPTTIRRRAAALSASLAATVHAVSGQAENARANSILSAYGRVGGVAAVKLVVVAYPPTATKDIAIAPNGAIATLAADAWTDMDVSYTVEPGDVVEVIANVVTNTLTLPANITALGAVMLIEAEATTASITGVKIVDAVGTAPATLHAALNAAKTGIAFHATDAVTVARVRLLVASSVDVSASLAATDSVYL